MDTFKDYDIFIISIDISLDRLEGMIEAKEYVRGVGDRLNRNYQDHVDFLKEHSDDVDVHITEGNFDNRLDVVLEKVKVWLK
jgi:predicted nucleotidyltransferase